MIDGGDDGAGGSADREMVVVAMIGVVVYCAVCVCVLLMVVSGGHGRRGSLGGYVRLQLK